VFEKNYLDMTVYVICPGVKEGIHDLERMIVRAKGYRMVIDWKLAYDEIKQIADNMRAAMNKKTPKPPKQGDGLYNKQNFVEYQNSL